MKSVSIIAATISGNRGAEAMLTTTIGEIRQRYPDCHFNVFSYYPVQDRALNRDSHVDIHSATPLAIVSLLFPFSILYALFKLPLLNKLLNHFPKALQALDQSDVLIDLAGVAFIDGREKFLPYNVLTLAPAFILNTPVIKFSQALGPFKNPLNRVLAKPTLNLCRQVFARGAGTYQHLQTLNLKSLYPTPVSDVAFRHRQEYSLSSENESLVSQLHNRLLKLHRPLIGVCPSSVIASKSLSEHGGYTANLARLCEKLIEQGNDILLFPNATRNDQGTKLRNNDLPVIRNISAQLIEAGVSSESIVAVDFDINTNGIKQIMPYCKILLVSRFHAMIAALSAKLPVIVLGWSHKYLEVMESFELAELVYDFKQVDMNAIAESIQQIIEDGGSVKAKLEQHLQANLDSSAKQFEYLFNHID
jgi:polysaccharide pyruvyl transferase WcaK-like protein